MNKTIFVLVALLFSVTVDAQTGLKKVYNETINPIEQIDQALVKAKSDGKFVICQVGGNWCPWCLRFADFITKDTTISKVVEEMQGFFGCIFRNQDLSLYGFDIY